MLPEAFNHAVITKANPGTNTFCKVNQGRSSGKCQNLFLDKSSAYSLTNCRNLFSIEWKLLATAEQQPQEMCECLFNTFSFAVRAYTLL